MQMPVQVRRAVILLWFMLAAGVVGLFSVNSFTTELAVATSMPYALEIMWAVMFSVLILNAILIVCISRRRNWARFVLLLVTLGGFAGMLWPEIYASPLPWD